MKTSAASAAILLAGLSFAAAGQVSPHEETLKVLVESFDKIAVTLKTIDNEASANAAKPVLRKSADAFLEARAKAEKMQPPELEEKRRLEKLYKPKIDDALKKINLQVQRIQLERIPGGEDALKEISSILKKPGK